MIKQKTNKIYSTKSKIDSEKMQKAQALKPHIVKKLSSKETHPETVKFVALGGFEEIGRNMMYLEYKDEIIIIDMGLQFPEEDTPGIDYIIPNISSLEAKKDNIRAVIITHGHYDHIGAIPHLMGRLGNPIIYTSLISKEIILKRQEDFPNAPKLNFEIVKSGDVHQLSEHFKVEFFGITHNVPDGFCMVLDTPVGKIVHGGEFKFDYDFNGNPRGLDVWKKIGDQNIHTLLLESTGAEVPGYSVSERIVEQELEKLFKKAEGRIIVGTFASLLDRLAEIIKIAEKLDKKVAISGFSMKNNIDIVRNIGYMKVEKNTIIPLEDIHKYRDDKLLLLCTGAQGEPNASLMRIANGEYRQIQIKKGDTVILSSSIVPGNERSVQVLKDNISRQGALVYHYGTMDIHSSGHAPQEELKTVMKLVRPKFFIPMHGYYFMRQKNSQNAQEAIGLKPQNIIMADNGQILEITKTNIKITEESVPAFYVMVDGLGVGDVGEIVMRDRKILAEEGMVVIIATLDRKTGRFLKNPDIISRGFIYLKENKELVEEVRKKIRLMIAKIPNHQQVEPDYIKALMRDQIGQFLYNKTKRRPMILPVVIQV
ncbi:ribonuclease J [Candidatus Wolfebacteria bacterium CG10_big_fil_rev_8_21_14_0_10_31_9]|uniref:Ribonuclease J n=1 Tax=Candidatus Wolfebacteria bacterium CG10_big_fil_rev_8_21_14_0_10_31_9 TaxID=1975070 RepID=A0A2H0RCU3_9BACT|nr:MAG: ribonuclease J [Candidatus Wolfebacteria bacterium CG10_big_fil_rev_8_21_14_0_10_31_9]